MAYIRCVGGSGGSIQKKTATGAVATFNTGLPAPLIDVTSAIGYRSNGYTSATVINSKTTPVMDETPYQTRIAPSNIGNMALEKLVGVSCVFNQLVNTGDTSINTVSGHKYYTSINGTKSIIQGGSAVSINDSSEDNVIDLTAMFGSEVADYLYTLESGTAGAGVSLFKSLFDADYYPYTANTLMSAKPTGKKIVGKNFFNGEYEELYELPFVLKKGTVVTASCVQTTENISYIYYYDKDGNLIDYWGISSIISGNYKYRTFTIDKDCYYMRLYIAPANDVQVEIGSTATAYEPYSETTIVYSGNELRGLLKVGTNGLYADGDIDDGSGTETVRYGIVDLGSLNWVIGNRNTDNDAYTFYYNLAEMKNNGGAITDNFVFNPNMSSWESLKKGEFGITDTYLIFAADYNSAYDFKTAMDGHYLIYELATPTTQTISAWTNPIVAKEGGTEEFTDSRSIALPTGHSTIYGTDLSVKKAEFGTTVFGGSVDFTTGEVISNKNADGTDKTAETISITPVEVLSNAGTNNVFSDTNGNTTAQYIDKR